MDFMDLHTELRGSLIQPQSKADRILTITQLGFYSSAPKTDFMTHCLFLNQRKTTSVNRSANEMSLYKSLREKKYFYCTVLQNLAEALESVCHNTKD